MRRTSVILSTLLLFLSVIVLASCGDTYRPIAIPIIPPGGDPQRTHYAVVVNTNNGQPADLTTGVGPSATQIDVSGDTNMGNRRTGLNPVHAAISSNFQAFVVNQGGNSVTTFLLTSSSNLTDISLEANAGPSFVAASSNMAFVSETALNRVAIIDSAMFAVKTFVDVGAAPVSLAVTPNGRQVYVANTGDGTISVISTQDNALVGSPISVGGTPVSMAMEGSGARLFVVTASGTLSVIDTATNAETQRITGLSNPTQVIWENKLQRVYVVDAGANTINIYSGSGPQLSAVRTVNLSQAPIGIAALDDGSRFYVLHGGTPGSVSVYDTQSFQVVSTINVQNTPVSIAAAPESRKVYVVNQTGDAGASPSQFPNGSVSIIKTSDNSVINIAAGAPKPVFVTTI